MWSDSKFTLSFHEWIQKLKPEQIGNSILYKNPVLQHNLWQIVLMQC